jgi:hypothetical protein
MTIPLPIDRRWKLADKRRRHRQTCPDDKREENKNHDQVGKPLEQVIRPCFCLTRPERKKNR